MLISDTVIFLIEVHADCETKQVSFHAYVGSKMALISIFIEWRFFLCYDYNWNNSIVKLNEIFSVSLHNKIGQLFK